MKNSIMAYFVSLALLSSALFSCENSTAPTNMAMQEEVVETPTEEPTIAPKPLNMERAVVSFKAIAQGENESGTPSARLYLYTSVGTDSLFLAEDVGGVKLEQDRYEAFNIPTDAILAIESYFAGGGSYYYVAQEGNVLTVYRGFMDEPNPEMEVQEAKYDPFKRYTFYEDSIVEEELKK